MKILALAARGTLPLVAAECRSLGLRILHEGPEGVDLDLDEAQLAKALVHLRIATRLLVRLATFPARDADSLYQGASEIDWSRWLDANSTFAVHASGDIVPSEPGRRGLDNTIFVALRIKDALCDQLVRRFGRRPDVAREDPEVRIVARGHRGRWSIFLDASEPALHERGFRKAQGPAPLKETLAAAIVETARWDGTGRLHDPMCGAGTLVIEALGRTLGIAPGCTRWFGIERWPHHGVHLTRHLDDVRGKAVAHAKEALQRKDLEVVASDIDPRSLEATRTNLKEAGLERMVRVIQADATTMERPPPGSTILANPPYGERIGGDEVVKLYEAMGKHWRTFSGCEAWILDGNEQFMPAFGLQPTSAMALWNGPLPVTLRLYHL
jgi:23S rRNA G2445 N2-methylase RlmL